MSAYGKLPVDFEERVKRPRPANGVGYPYQISAKDLMDNFKYLDAKESGGVPEGFVEMEVSICVAGVPTAYTILAKPA